MADRIAAGLLLIVALNACTPGESRLPQYELTGGTMGTVYSIKLVAPDQGVDRDMLGDAIDRRLETIERRFSTYLPDSEISAFNADDSDRWITVSVEFCGLVDRALELARLTDGAFDITVGPLVDLWGFGPQPARPEPPPADELAAAHSLVGHDRVTVDCDASAVRKEQPGVRIDLSAFAKGYAVDEIAELLDARGLGNYLVEIGGEISAHGHNATGEPWAIAIERPVASTRSVHTVVRLSEASMATSGDYRNYFEFQGRRYSHTIDPRTGWPVSHGAASVTVVGDSSADADALATALLVLGPDAGLAMAEREGIAALFLVRNDSVIEERTSSRFAAMIGA